MRPKTPTTFVCAWVLAFLFAGIFPPGPASADPTSEGTNPNASRTVTWAFATNGNLTAQGVVLEGGRATLAWVPANVSWNRPSDFLANGTLDPTLTTDDEGVVLRWDPSNPLLNGNFTQPFPWTFINGTSGGPPGNVTAEWDPATEVGRLLYRTPATESPWDTLDALGDWKADSNPGSLVTRTLNTTDPKEGTGMISLDFTLAPTAGSWAALYNSTTVTSPVDWSPYDRLVLWIHAPAVGSPLTFNVTAEVGGIPRSTKAQPLVAGAQEVLVDLGELGSVSERGALRAIYLRINGQNVPTPQTVSFDDVRLALSKSFSDSAMIRQDFVKANTTTLAWGSGLLAFDWAFVDRSGIQEAIVVVNLTGPSGSFEGTLEGAALGSWQHVAVDVSPTTSLNGTYTLEFRLLVRVNDTKPSDVEARVDNVSLSFPNRRNGTFRSDPVPLGPRSDPMQLTWFGELQAATSVHVAVRSGPDSTPDDGDWSPWEISTAPGTLPLDLPGGRYIQIRAFLNTTDARVSPTLTSVVLEARHRLSSGAIESKDFTARSDFLRWSSFNASFELPENTSLAFALWNGVSWIPLEPGATLAGFTNATLRWRAELSTEDGLATPVLLQVAAVYEFLGPAAHVRISPSGPLELPVGQAVTFGATAYDAGFHALALLPSQFDWSTDDPTGRVLNNGTYCPGTPGLWNVTVTISGTGISDSVSVRVVESPGPPGGGGPPSAGEFPYLLDLLLALAMAAAGYLSYGIAVRRMFAIEDLFVIAKDGRLMMHNTRRMRADRDEDILSAMLTAILSFVRDADREENGDLRRFDIGGKTTLLERGEHVDLAAVYSGRVPRWATRDLRRFLGDLEVRMADSFRAWDGSPEDLQGLRDFTTRFVSRARYRRRAVFPRRTSGSA